MTPEQIELGKRAVACKGWRWMPGMMRLRATPPSRRDHLRMEGRAPDGGDTWDYAAWPVIPDLTDPATLGCLLALVREAWGDRGMFARPRGSKMQPDWAVFAGTTSDIVCIAPTEAEALVAALEAAP